MELDADTVPPVLLIWVVRAGIVVATIERGDEVIGVGFENESELVTELAVVATETFLAATECEAGNALNFGNMVEAVLVALGEADGDNASLTVVVNPLGLRCLVGGNLFSGGSRAGFNR